VRLPAARLALRQHPYTPVALDSHASPARVRLAATGHFAGAPAERTAHMVNGGNQWRFTGFS